MQTDLQAIVLAAGKSTRFHTGNTKMLEKICGQELILYPTAVLKDMAIPFILVIGYQKDLIKDVVEENYGSQASFAVQDDQDGTGHALWTTKDLWEKDNILIMNGDTPLITKEILQTLIKKHYESKATISFITSHNTEPSSYSFGRVVKKDNSIKVIEAKELNRSELQEHCCINAGIYIVRKKFLQEHIGKLERNALSNEIHITELINIASDKKEIIATIAASFDHIRGINTFQELWAVEQVKRAELIRYWMNKGVRFSVPQDIHIDLKVTIGAGTFIGCGVHILNNSKIGTNCSIDAFCLLSNAILENNAKVRSHCVIKNATVGNAATIGPFAHLHDTAVIGNKSAIGNFVEVKNSTVGINSKAKHMSYLGDAQIGSHVNIGAGSITCNYDGIAKHKTVIEDHVFIGSNNCLVAPVTIHKQAFTAAGSVITDDVPQDALGIARSRQINKENYVAKIYNKKRQQDKKTENKNDDSNTSLSFIGAVKTNNDSTTLE